MRPFRLSDRAERSLDEIGAYSRENFGAVRGNAYIREILDRCRKVAQGRLPHQSCRAHFAEDLADDLRFVRAGQHFVIFVVTSAQITIVDFLHRSADVGRRLGGP